MFLTQIAAPVGLQMAAATQRQSTGPSESAYALAFNTSQTFQSACEQRPKLQRQWSAFLRYTGEMGDSVTELLNRLDWRSLANACIVDASFVAYLILHVGADSTGAAAALAITS
ncbi:hypothetical protein MMC22_007792 [Lobaria immixta]|nr:hypothetical protein [Lobaria immixta]